MSERLYLQLELRKSLERDGNGNYIVTAEASNESLDFQGQQVLSKALLESKDYFLANGVISYDHRHLAPTAGETDWYPEKYVIGEPLDVIRKGRRTFVKMKLYKSSPIVRDIIGKLKDGSTRVKTSIGGKRAQIAEAYDRTIGKAVEQVVKVLWDELAITFKPVNQSLEPIALSGPAFAKALMAGSATDSAGMTGGRAMIPQSLEGDRDADALRGAIGAGTVNTRTDAELFLKARGCGWSRVTAIVDGLDIISGGEAI